ncbi:hypothetical protein PVAND_012707 [Polypedilum vanderplanki]|uniref:Dynein regulatory complex subunit 4 n=1 Tax=Polypedilum vanderplanki TaxID=319348 RepID=A0A9J6CMF7_POLVA|nr:hypothetical protein PVAND_012707 [Polypedilum vanderplanki]
MGPKKKGGSSVIDGVDTAGMSREQLEAFCIKLRNELEREREERNFFQIERDKLRTFWEITRKQYEDSQAVIRNKEREVEMAQEMADLETKNVMQQMKHLQYENQSKIGDMRAEMMTQLKLAQEDHAIQEKELFNDKRELKKICRERDEFNELQIQQIKMKHCEHLSIEREKFQNELKEMANLHERRLQEYMENSEIRHRMEMSEVEERKNNQIRQLIDAHEKAFGEMKNYYNDITLNNLALISSIKEQMEEMRRQTERNEKQMADAHTAQNRSITEPVKDNQAETNELRKKLENYQRDKISMQKLQKRYDAQRKQMENLKLELDAKSLHCEKITEERDELKQKFEDAILDVQQRSSLKSAMLERKLSFLEKETEQRESLLGEVLKVSNISIEPTAISVRIEKLLSQKNEKIQDLRYELAKVGKAYDDLLEIYKAKMIKFGIPIEEVGMMPFNQPRKSVSSMSRMKH